VLSASQVPGAAVDQRQPAAFSAQTTMNMAVPGNLKLIGAANAEIFKFLENAPKLSHSSKGPEPSLSGIQERIAALMSAIQDVGRSLRALEINSLDDGARAEIDLYACGLRRLAEFLTALGSYAESRREQLAVQSRKVNQVLAWCDAVKLASRE